MAKAKRGKKQKARKQHWSTEFGKFERRYMDRFEGAIARGDCRRALFYELKAVLGAGALLLAKDTPHRRKRKAERIRRLIRVVNRFGRVCVLERAR